MFKLRGALFLLVLVCFVRGVLVSGEALLRAWLSRVLPSVCGSQAWSGHWQVVAGDASGRRYFRVALAGRSWVVMDASAPGEDCGRFVRLAKAFGDCGLRVPGVLVADEQAGFALLEDFGDRLLLDALGKDSVDRLYGQALEDWLAFQSRDCAHTMALPPYDRAVLVRELELFREWLLEGYLGLVLDAQDERLWSELVENLVGCALEQPQAVVHRDFHSRNLLLLPSQGEGGERLGVIDFQDALRGPVTYDLVSLLRDCYVAWPAVQVEGWLRELFGRLSGAGLLSLGNGDDAVDFLLFKRWFDWMGMQRHLKAAGIFARLLLRDGRDGYLADIPRTLGYVEAVASAYAPLQPFALWLSERVLVRLDGRGRLR